MSKKKLLEENTVSKFMKLAKIDTSKSKRFLNEMYGYDEKKSPAEEEEEGSYGMHEMGYGEGEEGKVPHEKEEMGGYGKDPLDIDELDLDQYMNEAEEEGEGDEMGELSMTSEEAKDIVSALEKLLDKLKTAVESGPEEEEPEMEEPEMEEPEAPEGEEEAPAPEGEEETPAALQEALVNKVARRVAARLLRESKAKAAVKKPVKPKK